MKTQYLHADALALRILLPLILLIATFPTAAQAGDYTYTTSNGQITVTGYTGPGGAVTIPDTIDGLPVTSIGNRAFYQRASVTSVTIPNRVTTIGDLAFVACTSLTSVTIGNSVTSIGLQAFYACTRLSSVTIPTSVTSIGLQAFRECTSLASVTIPNSVTTIGGGAFNGCTSLASVTIPNSVTSIENEAFSRCGSLTSVTIGNSVSNIGPQAFSGCFSLTSVTIPNSVTTIGERAFSGCASLASVMIGNSVSSIGFAAFERCTGLTSITIPNSVTTIGDQAFSGCTSLSAITVEVLNPSYSSVEGVLFTNSQTTLIVYPRGKTGSYTIPNSVTTIGEGAFYECTSLTSVTIPNSVTTIGNEAFSRCANLASVTIPNSVTTIGDYSFSRCTSLTSVTIPNSIATIKDGAFANCASLASVTIPNSVTSIGVLAFTYCGLTSITIPNSVTTIGDGAFGVCTSLTSVTIPNSVATIGVQAFFNCTSLTSVTIPDNVTRIGSRAFANCTSMASVTIPNRINRIENYAFQNCASLTSVTIPNSVTTIGDGAFDGCTRLTGVYFEGNRPSIGFSVLRNANQSTVYYLPGTTGWGATFAGRPVVLWNQRLAIPPQKIFLAYNQPSSFKFTLLNAFGRLIPVLNRSGSFPAATVPESYIQSVSSQIAAIFERSGIRNILFVNEDGPETLTVYFCESINSDLLGYARPPIDRFNSTRRGEVVVFVSMIPSLDAETAVHEMGHALGLRHVDPQDGDPQNNEVMDLDVSATPEFINRISDVMDVGSLSTHNPRYHLLRYVEGWSPAAIENAAIFAGIWDHGARVQARFGFETTTGKNLRLYNLALFSAGNLESTYLIEEIPEITISELSERQFTVNEGDRIIIVASSEPNSSPNIVFSPGNPENPREQEISTLGSAEITLYLQTESGMSALSVGASTISQIPLQFTLLSYAAPLLRLDFRGTLKSSRDLVTWEEVNVASPHFVEIGARNLSMFFRVD